MSLPESLLNAIAQTVKAAGGSYEDFEDLAWAWERLDHELDARAQAILSEARRAPCSCGTADVGAEGRCLRCFGRLR